MKLVPVERVDLMYPARTDDNGVTWYRPTDKYGWTSVREFAHPSYFHPQSWSLMTSSKGVSL